MARNTLSFLFASIALAAFLTAPAAAASWNKQDWCPQYSGLIFRDTANWRSGLQHIVTRYRNQLGGVDNGNAPGAETNGAGHRSINWDADVVPFNMPGDFFKNTVTRGAEFFAVEGKFAVSNPSPQDASGVHDNRFSSFNHAFPQIFKTFSPNRLFTPVKSNEVHVVFSVPASDKGDKATVSGFGAIFTNVRGDKTVLNFYDKNDCLIIRLPIPEKARGLSFGGIIVTKKDGAPVKAPVASVKATLGTGIISRPKNGKNFVVVDDLIYGEPIAVGY